MKTVKALKSFLQAGLTPSAPQIKFVADEVISVPDAIADRVVERGQAEFCDAPEEESVEMQNLAAAESLVAAVNETESAMLEAVGKADAAEAIAAEAKENAKGRGKAEEKAAAKDAKDVAKAARASADEATTAHDEAVAALSTFEQGE